MKKTIIIWTTVFLLCCAAVSVGVIWQRMSVGARHDADLQIQNALEETARLLAMHRQEMRAVRNFFEDELLVKTELSARLFSCQKELLSDRKKFEQLFRELNVDELHVSDEKGLLIHSIPQNTEGYDLAADPQSAPFLEALTNPKFRWVQPSLRKGIDDRICQFAGVARKDSPGAVQLGVYPQRLMTLCRLLDPSGIITDRRIGRAGGILLLNNEKVIAASSNSFVGRKLEELGLSREVLEDAKRVLTRLQGEEIFCNSIKSDECVLIGYLPLHEVYAARSRVIRWIIVADLAALAVLAGTLFVLLNVLIFRNVRKINHSLYEITQGDLNEVLEESGPLVFRMLARGINAMVQTLKTLAQEGQKHLREELTLARRVQMAALPSIFPPIPYRHRFSVAGCLAPTGSVGGDFYDYFPVGNDRAALVIVDVSGRGMGAALCTMEVKTMLHNFLAEGNTPAQCLKKANRQFCANNASDAFAAVWIAILDPKTGELTAASAGHRPPFYRHEGKWALLKIAPSLVLGGDSETEYHEETVTLTPNDRLLLYSDGVTDAVNIQQEFLGGKRLQQLLEEPASEEALTPNAWLQGLRQKISDFTAGAEQSDDQTMIALFYHGRALSPEKVELLATRANWLVLRDFLEDRLRSAAANNLQGNRLLVAMEELFVCVALHEGSAGQPCRMRITCFFDEELDTLHLSLNYADSRWDPVREARALTPGEIAEHPDLLGIQVVLKTMDEAAGQQEPDGSYTLKLSKKIHA